jgi:hypothetical protein
MPSCGKCTWVPNTCLLLLIRSGGIVFRGDGLKRTILNKLLLLLLIILVFAFILLIYVVVTEPEYSPTTSVLACNRSECCQSDLLSDSSQLADSLRSLTPFWVLLMYNKNVSTETFSPLWDYPSYRHDIIKEGRCR